MPAKKDEEAQEAPDTQEAPTMEEIEAERDKFRAVANKGN
jgi:hypothetical protein